MPDNDNSNPSPDAKPPKFPKPPARKDEDPDDDGSGFNWRSAILFACAGMLMALFFYTKQMGAANTVELAYQPDFQKALAEGRIRTAEIHIDNSTGEDRLRGKIIASLEVPKEMDYTVPINLNLQRNLLETLEKAAVPSIKTVYSHNWLASGIFTFLPLIVILLVLYFMFRQQIKMAGKGAFNFGKNRSKMITKDKNKMLFKDVAGCDEAKEEVQEIVEFLKDPKKFQKLGGRIPKGVLMVGPPGTGKTLLAKAIAGEADVPFFSISGSDFVEMFVGVGASRVRDLFEQGKRNAPCLIFIDEIDAVGRSRGHGVGGGNDEREQTLNAMLVEMDGFDTQEGVIIIAATNRKDVLDPALLRPGRFDREVRVNLPDVKGRLEILKVHAKNVKIAEDVNLELVARGTPGYSGAELANVMNEAALLAAKFARNAIAQSDLEEARDKVRWGKERRSMAMSLDEKKITAYHEAGHALLNVILEHTDPLHKVSIIPRGPALGVTMMLPERDRYNTRRKELVDDLCVTMGGRVAEEVFLGDISSGASGDIRQATYYARKMVCEWGMSEKLGMVQYEDDSDLVFLGRDIGRNRHFSEETQKEIDAEVRKLIDDAYRRATEIISANREKMEAISLALLEFETLEGIHIEEIVKHGKILTTPTKPTPPPAQPAPEQPAAAKKDAKDKADNKLPEGLAPAPIGA